MLTVTLNLNALVRFRPNERGRELLAEWGGVVKDIGDGVVSIQFWEFMRVFGPTVYSGLDVAWGGPIEVHADDQPK